MRDVYDRIQAQGRRHEVMEVGLALLVTAILIVSLFTEACS